MSKRVSIITPDELAAEGAATAEAVTPSSRRSSATSVRAKNSKSSLKVMPSADVKTKSETKLKSEHDTNANTESALVKLSMTDLFSDGCERYKKDCCCCHCVAVRKALRQAAYLQTPEGKERTQLKMHLKSFFMDINAMTHVRRTIEARLHGNKEPTPSPTKSFPITITDVEPIDEHCMSIDWYLHDDSMVTHYEIYVDNRRRKRIFNPLVTSTVLLDVDMKRSHKIRMRAMPKKCASSNTDPMDKLVRDVCCGGLNNILDSDYFCQCANKSKMEKIKVHYKRNSCQVLVDFWKDSEFFYIPSLLSVDQL
ncbi:uncharacterized protein LOC6561334 [Drosophila grimshawi]|uniref:GH20952 n=1 Tax=Drosophila grimshawi TaxID=7222 RepID=B4J4A4_DROGR|nr:uncharacterized protein LOC6561334 [Drosophila grimshawi]EDW00584.1 GH20952 [Drosophila grimshawi]